MWQEAISIGSRQRSEHEVSRPVEFVESRPGGLAAPGVATILVTARASGMLHGLQASCKLIPYHPWPASGQMHAGVKRFLNTALEFGPWRNETLEPLRFCANVRQFLPAANKDWDERFPGMFQIDDPPGPAVQKKKSLDAARPSEHKEGTGRPRRPRHIKRLFWPALHWAFRSRQKAALRL